MKKTSLLALVIILIIGSLFVAAQEDFLVSPRLWVLGTNAMDSITIHVAYPYSSAYTVDVVIKGDYGYTITDVSTFSDLRGDLVARFVPPADIAPGEYEVTLSIIDVKEFGPFEVTVKELNEPFLKESIGKATA